MAWHRQVLRLPEYLLANQVDRYPDLDENGHDPEALEIGATAQEKTGVSEHIVESTDGVSEHATGCDTGWIDQAELYITNGDGEVEGFRKANGSMASKRK